MKRGEVWTAAAGSGYSGKPRPALIVQDDRFLATASVTICPFTTIQTEDLPIRLRIDPSAGNGLDRECYLMVDKLNTIRRDKLGERVGALSAREMGSLDRAMAVFLGLAR